MIERDASQDNGQEWMGTVLNLKLQYSGSNLINIRRSNQNLYEVPLKRTTSFIV